jgi:hypothetical protein
MLARQGLQHARAVSMEIARTALLAIPNANGM